VEPYSRRLLQAVEGIVEPAHQLSMSGVKEVGGLGAVDRLDEGAMEEGFLDVELVHRLALGDDKS
jgi:hypothetical protein